MSRANSANSSTFLMAKLSSSNNSVESAILLAFYTQSFSDNREHVFIEYRFCNKGMKRIREFRSNNSQKTVVNGTLWKKNRGGKGKNNFSATAGSRTRVNGLGSRHDNRYTTVAHAIIVGRLWVYISLNKKWFPIYDLVIAPLSSTTTTTILNCFLRVNLVKLRRKQNP